MRDLARRSRLERPQAAGRGVRVVHGVHRVGDRLDAEIVGAFRDVDDRIGRRLAAVEHERARALPVAHRRAALPAVEAVIRALPLGDRGPARKSSAAGTSTRAVGKASAVPFHTWAASSSRRAPPDRGRNGWKPRPQGIASGPRFSIASVSRSASPATAIVCRPRYRHGQSGVGSRSYVSAQLASRRSVTCHAACQPWPWIAWGEPATFCASRRDDPLKLKRPFSMRFENGISGKWQQRTAGRPATRRLRHGLQHGHAVKGAGEKAAAERRRDADVPAAVAQLERVAHVSAELDRHPDRRARFRQRDDVAGDGLAVDDEAAHAAAAAARDFAPRSRSGRRGTRGAC